jgi:hypothetical protein
MGQLAFDECGRLFDDLIPKQDVKDIGYVDDISDNDSIDLEHDQMEIAQLSFMLKQHLDTSSTSLPHSPSPSALSAYSNPATCVICPEGVGGANRRLIFSEAFLPPPGEPNLSTIHSER